MLPNTQYAPLKRAGILAGAALCFMLLIGSMFIFSGVSAAPPVRPVAAPVVKPLLPPPSNEVMAKADFVDTFLQFREADIAECHSNPAPLIAGLWSLKNQYVHEMSESVNEWTRVVNPGPAGSGVFIAEMWEGKTPKLVTGEFLYIDDPKQEKFVRLYANEDLLIAHVSDSMLIPPNTRWIMFPLDEPLDPATSFASFWGNGEDRCADGAARAKQRQLNFTKVVPTPAATPAASGPIELTEGFVDINFVSKAEAISILTNGTHDLNTIGNFYKATATLALEVAPTTILLWGVENPGDGWMSIGKDGAPVFINTEGSVTIPAGAMVVFLDAPINPACDLEYWPGGCPNA